LLFLAPLVAARAAFTGGRYNLPAGILAALVASYGRNKARRDVPPGLFLFADFS
jgi:hypothetical protein